MSNVIATTSQWDGIHGNVEDYISELREASYLLMDSYCHTLSQRNSRWALGLFTLFSRKLSTWPPCITVLTGGMHDDLSQICPNFSLSYLIAAVVGELCKPDWVWALSVCLSSCAEKCRYACLVKRLVLQNANFKFNLDSVCPFSPCCKVQVS